MELSEQEYTELVSYLQNIYFDLVYKKPDHLTHDDVRHCLAILGVKGYV